MTSEQTKAELFAKDPNRFIDMNDLIVAIKRTEGGMSVMLRPSNRAELIKAYGEVNVVMLRTIMETDYAIEKEHKKIIHPANGGIMDFVRRGKR